MNGRILFLLCVVLASLLVSAESASLTLPREVFNHVAGEWSVEVRSPCKSMLSGAVNFVNESTQIAWKSESMAPTAVGAGEDGSDAPLTLEGLGPYITADVGAYEYEICEEQAITKVTPERPVLGDRMRTTVLKQYTGVLKSGRVTGCASTAARDVAIRVIAMPFGKDGTLTWKQRDAIQYMEITIDTKGLAGNCIVQKVDAGESQAGKRRRGGHRNKIGGAPGEEETLVAKGVVVVRLSRKSMPTRSFLERYYPTLSFAGMFVVYQAVYGYFSYRAAK